MSDEEFKMRVYQIMEDMRLHPFYKIVMIAKWLYQGNPERVQEVLSRQSEQGIALAEHALLKYGYLTIAETKESEETP